MEIKVREIFFAGLLGATITTVYSWYSGYRTGLELGHEASYEQGYEQRETDMSICLKSKNYPRSGDSTAVLECLYPELAGEQ